MSVIIHLEFAVTADDSLVTEILRETLSQTAAFSGNESVRVLQDHRDPSRLIVDMTWESEQAYDAYLAWRQTPEGANRLVSLFDGPPAIRAFDVRLTF
ncbi:putative quinol monooxygenase [Microbacterium sp. PMB16]|uniref:putative quinol monooxygenase n=1 Tax=Microbacterium sp. PMB16 TaxID=3120157 RepID=UPI003F4C0180